jgi:hypothetical protein
LSSLRGSPDNGGKEDLAAGAALKKGRKGGFTQPGGGDCGHGDVEGGGEKEDFPSPGAKTVDTASRDGGHGVEGFATNLAILPLLLENRR